ncbi:MAG TPA: hypothetical protein VMU04_17755 [Candidatus Acidoferrum sp.]|nr:hypothetical protein [Candidatus Acidoferrum sp.]
MCSALRLGIKALFVLLALPVVAEAQFTFTKLAWAGGRLVVVEAATNPAQASWIPLVTNTLAADTWFFSDPQWTNYPARFYRVRSRCSSGTLAPFGEGPTERKLKCASKRTFLA